MKDVRLGNASKAVLPLGAVVAACVWLAAANVPPLPSGRDPLLFYARPCGKELRPALERTLTSARHAIDMHMYALTDPALISLLHQKAQEGVRVVALYDPSASPSLTPFPWAYPVAAGGLMHRKILTVDDALVFFGSANMTSSSLDVHDNLTLGLHHPPLARFLRTCAAPSFLFRIYEQCAELWLLPDQQQRALTRLLHLIQRARTSIYVAMFTLTHPALLEALIEAHRRGVDVQVLLDFYTEQGASRKGAQRLLDAGVSLAISRGRQLLHHKMAYIDREVLVTGSANWTRSAFAKNQDGFIILHSLKRKQRHTLDAMWRALLLESEPR